ncbi:MAG: UDP-glucose 4-epimerase GalE [Bacteroidota bacterium]|jgi:UDP-glucose 4-epimerase
MKKIKVLVTGGTGYIGSHTVVELIQAGYEPLIIDNLGNSSAKILEQIEKITGVLPVFYKLDLCDEKATLDFIQEHHIQNIIHFAAFKAVGESVAEPLKYYHNNLYSLINLLEGYQNLALNLVFSSSCTVYGQPEVLPVSEQAPIKPAASPYGHTKQICEDLLRSAAQVDQQLNVSVLRYFNPVGAHASALIGELPIGIPQNLVPFITQTAIGKREKLTVFGKDYDTPDGTCIRDYIHVVDLAKAHVAALKALEQKNAANYQVFNVGTGAGSTVLQAIQAFEKVSAQPLNYEIGPRRPGDVEKVWGDVSKIKQELGWEAELDLYEMMRSAWAWENYLKEHPII